MIYQPVLIWKRGENQVQLYLPGFLITIKRRGKYRIYFQASGLHQFVLFIFKLSAFYKGQIGKLITLPALNN